MAILNGILQLEKPVKTGNLYAYEATQVITIDAVDEYHAVIGLSAGANNTGWTYLASATGAITDTASNGGLLRCTDVAHGLTTGQYVTLHGMADGAHSGTTRVTVISVDVFDCDDISHNSDADTGNWSRGSSLTADAGSEGTYMVTFSASILSAGTNKNYKFEAVKNVTDLDEFAAERKIAVASDLGNIAAGGIASVEAGDVLWLKVMGTTDATNLTIEHANMHVARA